MKMIVKCQRSITTTEEQPQMLFYTRDRSTLKQFDLTDAWDKVFQPVGFMEGHKFFAYVDWPDKSVPPILIEKIGDQNW